MIKLGDLLKNRRIEKRIELSQVSESTKIPLELIEALEEGQYDKFSSEVYLKGLLKNYAKYLGIDTQKALAIYRRDKKEFHEQSLKDSQKPIQSPKALVTPGRIVFVVTLGIVLAVLGFVVVQVNKIIQPPTLELSEPVVGVAPGEFYIEVPSDSISLVGKVEVGSKLLVNGNEVTTNNLQEFRVDDFKLNPGSNEIFIVAESYYFSKTSEMKLTVLSDVSENESTPEEGEANEEEAEVTEEEELDMKIDISVGPESAWVVATVDDVTKVEDTVLGGTDYSFTAKEIFTIYSPRPAMVTLTINGEEYNIGSQTATIFKLVDGAIIQE
jgi:cytoskeletal protein RodZ